MRLTLVIVLAATSTAYAAGRAPLRPSVDGVDGLAEETRETTVDTTDPGRLVTLGSRIFAGRGCGACHTIGAGPKVGPDLAGVTARRDPAWFRAMVTRPDSMLRDDPRARALHERYLARMPDVGVEDAEVDALWAYLAVAAEPAAFAGAEALEPGADRPGPATCPHHRGRGSRECPGGRRCRRGRG